MGRIDPDPSASDDQALTGTKNDLVHGLLGIEGGGLLNLGAGGVMGLSYVTNAVGFWYDLSSWQQVGIGYEFQVSQPIMLFNNYAMCQYVLRY